MPRDRPKERGSVEERVKRVLINELVVSEKLITPSASLKDDLGMDSLDNVQVIMGCEEEFNFEIPDGHFDSVKTVKDIIAYVEQRLLKDLSATKTPSSDSSFQ